MRSNTSRLLRFLRTCALPAVLGAVVMGGWTGSAWADVPPATAASQTPRAGPTSLAHLSLDKRADVSYIASPSDWGDQNIYMAMVDRFNTGKATTPENLQRQPNDPHGWHGGNLTGITEKLDYLKGLGMKSIWVSPILGEGGAKGGYHGYWIVDFLDSEKHFGTMDDMRKLVAEAHNRGIHVLMDIVVNHTGRVFEYKEEDRFDGSGHKKEIAKYNTQIYPKKLMAPENFHREGTTTQKWDPKETVEADFIDGLRDFDLGKTEVQDRFIKIYKYLIAQTGVDGFRVDTVKHVEPAFWPRFNRAIKIYAATLGMRNFATFPEYFAATPQDMNRLTNEMGFTGALNFTSYFGETASLHGAAPTRQIEESHNQLSREVNSSVLRLTGRQLDNHDLPRFLSSDHDTRSQLKVALARLFFGSGIPVLQYGTEQGIRPTPGLPADPGNDYARPDMFAGGQKWKGATGDSFNTQAPLYRTIRLMNDVRDTYEPLRRGQEWARWSDPNGPGVYAFSRIANGKEVVVVINTSDEPREARGVWVDHDIWKDRVGQGGAKLVDALHPSYATHVVPVQHDGAYTGAQIGDIKVAPHGVRVMVYENEYVPVQMHEFDERGNVLPPTPNRLALTTAATPKTIPIPAPPPQVRPTPIAVPVAHFAPRVSPPPVVPARH